MKAPKDYEFEVSFDLVDAGKVVYHPNYYILLERARYDFCKQLGLELTQHFHDGFAFVIAEIQAKYRKPLLLSECYKIHSKILKVSTRSLQVEQEIFFKEDLHFTAVIHLVHVDISLMKTSPIPEPIHKKFTELCH